MICYPHYLLAAPRNIGVHTSTLEYASTADISIAPTSPQSWFTYIGMDNSISEYASTASISIVMTMPFKKRFLKKWFSPQISSKPPSPQVMKHRKRAKKEEEKEKLQESL
jgi:hypothetical protein